MASGHGWRAEGVARFPDFVCYLALDSRLIAPGAAEPSLLEPSRQPRNPFTEATCEPRCRGQAPVATAGDYYVGPRTPEWLTPGAAPPLTPPPPVAQRKLGTDIVLGPRRYPSRPIRTWQPIGGTIE